MSKLLIKGVLFINRFFPNKEHPFNTEKWGVLNLNYADFEYNHTKWLLDMYSEVIDLKELSWKRILDVWCWAGWKWIYIAENYWSNVIWIDLNLNFLNQALNKAKEKKVSKLVSFKEENALNLSFNDNEFDIIIMSDVIEHIPDTEVLFKEVYRVLKKWGKVIFDFAPYYHYFWHHIWDTIRIPWLHLFTTEKFRVELYKESVKGLGDSKARIKLRIWKNKENKEIFSYLNWISRKTFENIICEEEWRYEFSQINYKMIKNIKFFSYVPLLREVFIRHIIWVLKK